MLHILLTALILQTPGLPQAPSELSNTRPGPSPTLSLGTYSPLTLRSGEKEFAIGMWYSTFSWGTSWGEIGIKNLIVPGIFMAGYSIAYGEENQDNEYAIFVLGALASGTLVALFPQPYVKFRLSEGEHYQTTLLLDIGLSGGAKLGYVYTDDSFEFHILGGFTLLDFSIGWPAIKPDTDAAILVPAGITGTTALAFSLSDSKKVYAWASMTQDVSSSDSNGSIIGRGVLSLRVLNHDGSFWEFSAGAGNGKDGKVFPFLDIRHGWR